MFFLFLVSATDHNVQVLHTSDNQCPGILYQLKIEIKAFQFLHTYVIRRYSEIKKGSNTLSYPIHTVIVWSSWN